MPLLTLYCKPSPVRTLHCSVVRQIVTNLGLSWTRFNSKSLGQVERTHLWGFCWQGSLHSRSNVGSCINFYKTYENLCNALIVRLRSLVWFVWLCRVPDQLGIGQFQEEYPSKADHNALKWYVWIWCRIISVAIAIAELNACRGPKKIQKKISNSEPIKLCDGLFQGFVRCWDLQQDLSEHMEGFKERELRRSQERDFACGELRRVCFVLYYSINVRCFSCFSILCTDLYARLIITEKIKRQIKLKKWWKSTGCPSSKDSLNTLI